jgi:hypothetical protein
MDEVGGAASDGGMLISPSSKMVVAYSMAYWDFDWLVVMTMFS